jgi:hypothetical protein
MTILSFLLLSAALTPAAEPPSSPGLPGYGVAVSSEPVAAPAPAPTPAPAPGAVSTPTAPAEPKRVLFPPAVPARPKGTLDTASEVARDLAVRVQYFEDGQSYYRAYTKSSHTPEENKAFVKFLEEYYTELGIAKRVHSILGGWLEKKTAIKD